MPIASSASGCRPRSTAGSRPSSSTGTAPRSPTGPPTRASCERWSRSCARSGFDLVVITGTHVGNVDGQLGARPAGPGRLYLLCQPRLRGLRGRRGRARARRPARGDGRRRTRRSTRPPRRPSRSSRRRGVPAEVVSQRLNRRKIDLIPEPEWADPPKARIAELLAAVQERLRAAGLAGLGAAVEIALAAARARRPARSARDERRQARRDRAHRQGRLRALGVRRARAPR